MLPPANRMRRSGDFAAAIRGGRRVRVPGLLVHHLPEAGSDAAVVGFVVSKAVGGSVVRHRVARRLRAQVAERLELLPVGSATVVRALPQSADAESVDLGSSLDTAFQRLLSRRSS
ncbi:MAG: ribonuclease P protein component [Actinobacteria bacterium]|nr:ribonuclease P protein component [Actinomycetota bacterium]